MDALKCIKTIREYYNRRKGLFMGKKILILGNGFDLDLGMKTKYSDFMSSKTWTKAKDGATFTFCNLIYYLEEKKNKEAWFDLESELLNYALEITEGAYRSPQEDDRTGFDILLYYLKRYLRQEQENYKLNQAPVAVRVMRAVVENGFFDEIFTFNYTDINRTLAQAGVNCSIPITYMHGSLKEHDNIVLGIETDKAIHPSCQFMFKTNSRYYRYNNLIESMEKSDEIIFFGHSINGMDFPYFKDFFIKQSQPMEGFKRKTITIFTYDNYADQQIRNNFRNAGIGLRELMARNNLTFVETERVYSGDDFEKDKLNEIMKHLKEDSLEVEQQAENNILQSML